MVALVDKAVKAAKYYSAPVKGLSAICNIIVTYEATIPISVFFRLDLLLCVFCLVTTVAVVFCRSISHILFLQLLS